MWYFYDADGNPSGIRYKNGDSINDYYFVCNWRGDVIQIYNASGELVSTYDYDAWGKPIFEESSLGASFVKAMIMAATNVGYRGYFYDFETGLYYLRSRYYDPAVKRFVNGVMYSFYISEKNSLKSINVSKENPYYLSVNGILFSKKPLKVLCIPGVYYLE